MSRGDESGSTALRHGAPGLLEAWARGGQPCLFGRHVARRGRLTIGVLGMDPDRLATDEARARLAGIRSQWRADCLAGRSLGLLVVLAHEEAERQGLGAGASEIAVRLVEAFTGERVEVGAVALEDVYLAHPDGELAWRWRVPINTLFSGARGTWARARHVPGGIALVVNSVAQFAVATRGVAAGGRLPAADMPAVRDLDPITVGMSHRTIDNCWPSAHRRPALSGQHPSELAAQPPADEPGVSTERFYSGYDLDAAVPSELFGGAPPAGCLSHRFTTSWGQVPVEQGTAGDARSSVDARSRWQQGAGRACELAELVAKPLPTPTRE